MLDFVFGYGSLINGASRARTGLSGGAVPVRVRGWRRAWDVLAPDMGMTALGVSPDPGASANGVLVRIPDGELAKFDAREGGYDRVPVEPATCTALRGAIPAGQVWVYVPRAHGVPNERCPIVQTYVDVVMAGCLEVCEDFAREFVRTTALWDRPRENDRERPRYVRADRTIPPARLAVIDRIIAEEAHRPRHSGERR